MVNMSVVAWPALYPVGVRNRSQLHISTGLLRDIGSCPRCWNPPNLHCSCWAQVKWMGSPQETYLSVIFSQTPWRSSKAALLKRSDRNPSHWTDMSLQPCMRNPFRSPLHNFYLEWWSIPPKYHSIVLEIWSAWCLLNSWLRGYIRRETPSPMYAQCEMIAIWKALAQLQWDSVYGMRLFMRAEEQTVSS